MRILKRTTTVLFLLVYFSSSFITTQYRSERTARHMLRAAAEGSGVQVRNWTLSVDLYPHYREAKKATFHFGFPPEVAVNLSPQAGEREFMLSPLYWEVYYSRRVAADRAPPLQA